MLCSAGSPHEQLCVSGLAQHLTWKTWFGKDKTISATLTNTSGVRKKWQPLQKEDREAHGRPRVLVQLCPAE